MKSRKIFLTTLANAYVFYTVFESCGVFSILKNGKMFPVYDFSGNGIRSTLNALRNEGFDNPSFHFVTHYVNDPEIPTPYFMRFMHCYVYF